MLLLIPLHFLCFRHLATPSQALPQKVQTWLFKPPREVEHSRCKEKVIKGRLEEARVITLGLSHSPQPLGLLLQDLSAWYIEEETTPSRCCECAAVLETRASTEINDGHRVCMVKRNPLSHMNVSLRMRWALLAVTEEASPCFQLFGFVSTAHIPGFRKCVRLEPPFPLHCNHSYTLHLSTLWNSSTSRIRNSNSYSQKTTAMLHTVGSNEARPLGYALNLFAVNTHQTRATSYCLSFLV